MIALEPVTLEGHGVRLEPLEPEHANDLAAAVTDGRLWELWFTSVPEPENVGAYIDAAFAGQRAGHMLAWVFRREVSSVGSSSTAPWPSSTCKRGQCGEPRRGRSRDG